MRIILEGADGVGKTTLANILAQKYGLDICHCTQHDATDYAFYSQTLRKENTVWDRHTIGELIYPKVFNRETQITPYEAKAIIESAKQEGIKIFVLTCGTRELATRIAERKGEHPKIVENLDWINKSFKECAKWLSIPVIDTSKMTLSEIFKLVEAE